MLFLFSARVAVKERSPTVRAKLKAIGEVYNIIGAVTFIAVHGQRRVDCGITEGGLNEHYESRHPSTPLKEQRAGNESGSDVTDEKAARTVPRPRNNGSFETRLPFPFNDAYVSMGRSCYT